MTQPNLPVIRKQRYDNPHERAHAEDRAWAELYRKVGNVHTATVVIQYMLDNEECRERNEALYLLACQTVLEKQNADENKARALRALHTVFVAAPARIVRSAKFFLSASAPVVATTAPRSNTKESLGELREVADLDIGRQPAPAHEAA